MKLIHKNNGEEYALSERIITIGFSEKCHIKLKGKRKGEFAAHLLHSRGSYVLQKLGANINVKVNGLAVNNGKNLSHGDQISVGAEDFVFYGHTGSERVSVEKEDSGESVTQPVLQLIRSIVLLLRDKDDGLFNNLVESVSTIMQCDASRLVIEGQDGETRTTIARYPHTSKLDRFSNRAINWAKESGETVLASDNDWEVSEESVSSLERNCVGSVMCAPLSSNEKLLGFLYLDRLSNSEPFSQKDKEFCDALIPLFSEILSNYEEKQRQRETIARLQDKTLTEGETIIHESECMADMLKLCRKIARTNSPALIGGETGTGKELIAKYLHQNSTRSHNVFKAINCGAIPENLMESELFGHEKGAFTGATNRREGLFEAASGGTVFLDEIGELPLSLQVKLLRVLQESEVTRVGGSETIKVDVRVVAASNRNLANEVENGNFRQDLFFRLNVLTIELPPLRQRGTDVTLLADYFIKKYSQQFGFKLKTLSLAARNALITYEWPGNIRELENVIQKAVLLSDNKRIEVENLSFNGSMTPVLGNKAVSVEKTGTLREARNEAEKEAIFNALTKSKGNVSLAGKILQIDRKWLMKKMGEFKIDANDFRN
ncbi:sigma 54-interacting transcriptional regulator [Chitinispirillales bacterium ANBcel5]|uniref:sigma 54-interacting transcriptional regulator n=1 Tax=Cellulosispirillum alkaliphilum TaxID=3039283 RepID=UPI002A5796E4|nr:sigma 54-interacting transcriptional regulator [Chitinispirillales bacterium ANBcel5]